MRTFIVGSSHVTRLPKYIERGHDFRLQNHVISIERISGGMVSSVYQCLIGHQTISIGCDNILLEIKEFM